MTGVWPMYTHCQKNVDQLASYNYKNSSQKILTFIFLIFHLKIHVEGINPEILFNFWFSLCFGHHVWHKRRYTTLNVVTNKLQYYFNWNFSLLNLDRWNWKFVIILINVSANSAAGILPQQLMIKHNKKICMVLVLKENV